MRIENVSLREVQEVWETNRKYSVASRSPEMIALVDALSKMDVGEAKAVGYAEGRSPNNVKLQVQKAAKLVGKNVNVVIDESRAGSCFRSWTARSVDDGPEHRVEGRVDRLCEKPVVASAVGPSFTPIADRLKIPDRT